MFQVTLHELTACICHNLAVNRGIRGCKPDSEMDLHRSTASMLSPVAVELLQGIGHRAVNEARDSIDAKNDSDDFHAPRCMPASEHDISLAIRYAPLALKVAYESDPVDEQRLGSLQDLKLIYTSTESNRSFQQFKQRYSLFATDQTARKTSSGAINRIASKEAVLVLRSDMPLDELAMALKDMPTAFPPAPVEVFNCLRGLECSSEKGVAAQSSGSVESRLDDPSFYPCQGHACPTILAAAMQIMQEVCPSLNRLFLAGFHITIVGHSTAGSIASIISFLLAPFFVSSVSPLSIQSVSYGAPCCVDFHTSTKMKRYHTNVVLHDDVVPRLSKQSLAKLLRDVVVFRSTVFRHKDQDWKGVMVRAMQSKIHRPNHGIETEVEPEEGGEMEIALDYFYGSSAMENANSPNNAMSNNASQRRMIQDADAVMVETESCPEIFLPGKTLHIFFNRGQYHCSEVSCNFPELRTINVQTHMFSDHSNANILNALLEVRAVRKASATPPMWTAYHSTNVCQTCRNSFTWHSTFKGQLQEYRERYNCRHCGALVCGPCSTQRRSIPKYGMIFPRRICDRCVLTGEFAEL